MSAPPEFSPCLDALTAAELFAVCTARVFRVTRVYPVRGCRCLPELFEKTGMFHALPVFLQFQIALTADPDRSISYEAKTARFVGSGELTLLSALSNWQLDRVRDAQDALWFIRVRAIRRVAAEAGRAFALEMHGAGLMLPKRTTYFAPRAPGMSAAYRGVHRGHRVH